MESDFEGGGYGEGREGGVGELITCVPATSMPCAGEMPRVVMPLAPVEMGLRKQPRSRLSR